VAAKQATSVKARDEAAAEGIGNLDEDRCAGDVAARPIEAGDETLLDRVTAAGELGDQDATLRLTGSAANSGSRS
jgi:hypothetical protein